MAIKRIQCKESHRGFQRDDCSRLQKDEPITGTARKWRRV